jgi:hypothetical protein
MQLKKCIVCVSGKFNQRIFKGVDVSVGKRCIFYMVFLTNRTFENDNHQEHAKDDFWFHNKEFLNRHFRGANTLYRHI